MDIVMPICMGFLLMILFIVWIYWLLDILYETDEYFPKEEQHFSPLWKIILSILTCGLYGIYWWYKIGKHLHGADKKKISNKAWLYAFLRFLDLACYLEIAYSNVSESEDIVPNEACGIVGGLGLIIIMILVQKDLNILKNKKKKSKE